MLGSLLNFVDVYGDVGALLHDNSSQPELNVNSTVTGDEECVLFNVTQGMWLLCLRLAEAEHNQDNEGRTNTITPLRNEHKVCCRSLV